MSKRRSTGQRRAEKVLARRRRARGGGTVCAGSARPVVREPSVVTAPWEPDGLDAAESTAPPTIGPTVSTSALNGVEPVRVDGLSARELVAEAIDGLDEEMEDFWAELDACDQEPDEALAERARALCRRLRVQTVVIMMRTAILTTYSTGRSEAGRTFAAGLHGSGEAADLVRELLSSWLTGGARRAQQPDLAGTAVAWVAGQLGERGDEIDVAATRLLRPASDDSRHDAAADPVEVLIWLWCAVVAVAPDAWRMD